MAQALVCAVWKLYILLDIPRWWKTKGNAIFKSSSLKFCSTLHNCCSFLMIVTFRLITGKYIQSMRIKVIKFPWGMEGTCLHKSGLNQGKLRNWALHLVGKGKSGERSIFNFSFSLKAFRCTCCMTNWNSSDLYSLISRLYLVALSFRQNNN